MFSRLGQTRGGAGGLTCDRGERSYLEGAGLQQADLVVLGQVSEAGDLLGKLHHLLDGGGEALGELLPHRVAGLLGVHLGGGVHRADLEGGTETLV